MDKDIKDILKYVHYAIIQTIVQFNKTKIK